ncbi:MAG: LPS export ABC transporter permease LptG [Acidobacteria bacterium]|nr:LPS export ABC transporter permease LptG [Acidobacteriota bacterium]MBV9474589.1 LPS export ABC transporter permease LptG [Acidobacteriota bacterium]
MKILTRYIFKEMLGPTLLGFAFYTSIILMQRLFDMAGMIIRRSLSGAAVGKLLLYSMPHIIVLTVPMSLLFGILIAIGRLSSDSEIVAMRALGISTRTIYRPVFLFSTLVFLLSLYLINFVMPKGNQQFVALRAELMTSSAEKAIQPRIFYDQYENLMIYVNDTDPATGKWKGVFVADNRADESHDATTPQQMSNNITAPHTDDDSSALVQTGGGQRVIVAQTGNLSILKPSKEVWMNLQGAETHIWDPRRPDRYDFTRNASQRIRLPSINTEFTGNQLARSLREMDLRELLNEEQKLRRSTQEEDRMTRNLARVEIHKKFAIPFACIAFGILGLPLGITNRRGGKSSGFSLSIAIILFYYVMINNGEHLAATGKVSPAVGMWAANVLLLILGFYLLSRANRDVLSSRPEGGIVRRIAGALSAKRARRSPAVAVSSGAQVEDEPVLNRLDITFPNILDRYILREFLKILAMVLISVVALFIIVDYTEIAKEVRENNIGFDVLLTYYRFQIFQVLNWTLPISVLVATLVTFGVLSKNNEVTAIKSNGVSLYRIAVPIVCVAAIISVLAYFILDFILPYSNQRVDELKRTIQGKPPVTSAAQQKLWYRGKGRYLINFLTYDKNAKQLTQVQVFEFHPTEFRLTRRVYANHARWNGQAWAFEDGWMRSFGDDGRSTFTRITQPLALFYPERPEDFATEVKPPDQMTYAQLRRYIQSVRSSGYGADELSVKLYSKASWPVISLVMSLIALPFAFRMGKRGALYGIGIALVVGIVYWMIYAVFTKFGEVGNLPPLLSAWSANILFALSAIYLFLDVET